MYELVRNCGRYRVNHLKNIFLSIDFLFSIKLKVFLTSVLSKFSISTFYFWLVSYECCQYIDGRKVALLHSRKSTWFLLVTGKNIIGCNRIPFSRLSQKNSNQIWEHCGILCHKILSPTSNFLFSLLASTDHCKWFNCTLATLIHHTFCEVFSNLVRLPRKECQPLPAFWEQPIINL